MIALVIAPMLMPKPAAAFDEDWCEADDHDVIQMMVLKMLLMMMMMTIAAAADDGAAADDDDGSCW